jgi:hypothetical protein
VTVRRQSQSALFSELTPALVVPRLGDGAYGLADGLGLYFPPLQSTSVAQPASTTTA